MQRARQCKGLCVSGLERSTGGGSFWSTFRSFSSEPFDLMNQATALRHRQAPGFFDYFLDCVHGSRLDRMTSGTVAPVHTTRISGSSEQPPRPRRCLGHQFKGLGKAVIPRKPQRGVVVNVAWSWQLRLSRHSGCSS